MKIEVLGTGCPKCIKMYEATQEAVDATSHQAEVHKVYDLDEIARYGVYSFPAIVIDGEVCSTGRLLKADAIVELLEKRFETQE